MSDDRCAPSDGVNESAAGDGAGTPSDVDDRRWADVEVRARRLVIVDEAGIDRVSIEAAASAGGEISLFDGDGFRRIRIAASAERGAVTIAAQAPDGEPTRVEVFGLDRDGTDGAYVGVEVIDRGTSVAGIALQEGRAPQVWTATQ